MFTWRFKELKSTEMERLEIWHLRLNLEACSLPPDGDLLAMVITNCADRLEDRIPAVGATRKGESGSRIHLNLTYKADLFVSWMHLVSLSSRPRKEMVGGVRNTCFGAPVLSSVGHRSRFEPAPSCCGKVGYLMGRNTCWLQKHRAACRWGFAAWIWSCVYRIY